jgi:hypothetical protein
VEKALHNLFPLERHPIWGSLVAASCGGRLFPQSAKVPAIRLALPREN